MSLAETACLLGRPGSFDAPVSSGTSSAPIGQTGLACWSRVVRSPVVEQAGSMSHEFKGRATLECPRAPPRCPYLLHSPLLILTLLPISSPGRDLWHIVPSTCPASLYLSKQNPRYTSYSQPSFLVLTRPSTPCFLVLTHTASTATYRCQSAPSKSIDLRYNQTNKGPIVANLFFFFLPSSGFAVQLTTLSDLLTRSPDASHCCTANCQLFSRSQSTTPPFKRPLTATTPVFQKQQEAGHLRETVLFSQGPLAFAPSLLPTTTPCLVCLAASAGP